MMKRALVFVMVAVTAAHADDPKATAERYFRAGAKAYAAQNFSAAASDFDEAYKAMPLPEIAFSAAQAYRRLFRVEPKPEYVRRSVELYRVYLDKVKTGGRVGDAADSLGEMERELDHLKIKLEPTAAVAEKTRLGVNVTISGEVEGPVLREIGDATGEATKGLVATLDGKPIEPFALVDVEAKDHVITVTAPGFVAVEKQAKAVAGQSHLIEVELKPKPATLAVVTETDAQIAVDGRPVASQLELAAGKHLLTIVHRGRVPWGRELVVARGETLKIDAPLAMTSRRKAVPWVVGTAGVLAAGAITTTIVALVRDSKASDLRASIDAGNQLPTVADDYDHTVASRDHFVTASYLLGGAAIAAGATGLLLYLFDEPQLGTATERLHFAPVASPGGAGAVIGGRF
jgi:hypothetical protein